MQNNSQQPQPFDFMGSIDFSKIQELATNSNLTDAMQSFVNRRENQPMMEIIEKHTQGVAADNPAELFSQALTITLDIMKTLNENQLNTLRDQIEPHLA